MRNAFIVALVLAVYDSFVGREKCFRHLRNMGEAVCKLDGVEYVVPGEILCNPGGFLFDIEGARTVEGAPVSDAVKERLRAKLQWEGDRYGYSNQFYTEEELAAARAHLPNYLK